MAVRPAVDPGLVYLPPLIESAEMQDVQPHSVWQNRVVSRDVVRCFTDSVPRHAHSWCDAFQIEALQKDEIILTY